MAWGRHKNPSSTTPLRFKLQFPNRNSQAAMMTRRQADGETQQRARRVPRSPRSSNREHAAASTLIQCVASVPKVTHMSPHQHGNCPCQIETLPACLQSHAADADVTPPFFPASLFVPLRTWGLASHFRRLLQLDATSRFCHCAEPGLPIVQKVRPIRATRPQNVMICVSGPRQTWDHPPSVHMSETGSSDGVSSAWLRSRRRSCDYSERHSVQLAVFAGRVPSQEPRGNALSRVCSDDGALPYLNRFQSVGSLWVSAAPSRANGCQKAGVGWGSWSSLGFVPKRPMSGIAATAAWRPQKTARTRGGGGRFVGCWWA
jgi:hypothetical protein